MSSQQEQQDKKNIGGLSRRRFLQRTGLGITSMGLGAAIFGGKQVLAGTQDASGTLNRIGKEDLAAKSAAKGKKNYRLCGRVCPVCRHCSNHPGLQGRGGASGVGSTDKRCRR